MASINADLRDIRYFAVVIEHGSLTKAAQTLHVSQPTLSHAIARLEDALGGALWRRVPNRRARILPTELGKRALERGRRALAELTALEADAQLLRGVQAGELSVGSVQSLAGSMVPRCVSAFMARHPGVVLDLPQVTSETAPELIRQGKVDAAFMVGPASAESGLRRMRCGEQELVLVTRSDHPLARAGGRVPLGACAREPFLLVTRGTYFAVAIDQACRRAGFVPQARARLASISGLCALVRAGIGVTILPEGSVPVGDRDLIEVSFEGPPPKRPVYLAWQDGVEPAPALSAFLALTQSLAQAGSLGEVVPRLRVGPRKSSRTT